MIQFAIGSTNPVKIDAASAGFQQMFPETVVRAKGISVASGVSDQPSTDNETFQGAYNRVQNVRKEYPEADFWVGIEGGIERQGNQMEAFAWIVVRSLSRAGVIGKARTASFLLPPQVVELIDAGKELGEADDIVFGRTDSKQQNGAVGILTGDVIDRTTYYTQGVILSLIPFKNTSLF